MDFFCSHINSMDKIVRSISIVKAILDTSLSILNIFEFFFCSFMFPNCFSSWFLCGVVLNLWLMLSFSSKTLKVLFAIFCSVRIENVLNQYHWCVHLMDSITMNVHNLNRSVHHFVMECLKQEIFHSDALNSFQSEWTFWVNDMHIHHEQKYKRHLNMFRCSKLDDFVWRIEWRRWVLLCSVF